MLDTIIRGGAIVDGTGSAPFTGDVGILGDRMVGVGRVDEPARDDEETGARRPLAAQRAGW